MTCFEIASNNVRTFHWKHKQVDLKSYTDLLLAPDTIDQADPASSLRTKVGWVVGLSKSVVGVRKGRGRDGLTDEIAKKNKKAGVLPHKTMFPKGKGTPVPSDGQAREK